MRYYRLRHVRNEHLYWGGMDLGPVPRSEALNFTSRHDAENELHLLRTDGRWPLMAWVIVRDLRKAKED